MEDKYYTKYLKYKNKYLDLLKKGGSDFDDPKTNLCLENFQEVMEILDENIAKEPRGKKYDDMLVLKENYNKLKNINDILIELISKNDGLTKIMPMSQVKEILKLYLSNKENVDIIKKYKELSNYIEEGLLPSILGRYIFTTTGNSILFFLKIINEYNKDYDSYFLGDSTSKFQNLMEILRPDVTFKSILFSGNMYTKTDKTDKYKGVINEDYKKLMAENVEEYYKNNKSIVDELFDNLKKPSGRRIAIYDFVDTGASIPTFIHLIKLLNKFYMLPNIDSAIKSRLLFINFVGHWIKTKDLFNKISNKIGVPNEKINYILINIDIKESIWEHIVNSDTVDKTRICARCIPYYKPALWNTTPTIFLEDGDGYKPNYIGCNINRFFLYIYLVHVFNSIDPDISKLKFIKSKTSEYFIHGESRFFLNELRENIDSSNKKKVLIDVTLETK